MYSNREEYITSVPKALNRIASNRFGHRDFNLVINPDTLSVSIEIKCPDGKIFRIQVRGDVFTITYENRFDYLNFMVDVEEELEELASKALFEIGRICEGQSRMVPAVTFFRRRPLFTHDTVDGEQWRFYS